MSDDGMGGDEECGGGGPCLPEGFQAPGEVDGVREGGAEVVEEV